MVAIALEVREQVAVVLPVGLRLLEHAFQELHHLGDGAVRGDKRREELKAKRQELAKTRPKSAEPRATSKSATKKPKKAAKKQDDDSGKATEDRFRDLIAEVNLKVSKIQLTKDDHKTYSDVQTEIDSFLSEAISDILGIKANLKKRWEAVQSGKKRSGASNGRRNRSRQPRPRTRKDSSTEKPADGGQQSVFSKAQQV